MKISVRTLLALSDPACKPELRESLQNFLEKQAHTAEDQEEAKRFIHRVQTVTGIPLRAPEFINGSEEIDPNDVAEYLDYKLSAEEEGRFEPLCLSSDVFLAELADVFSFLNHSPGQAVEIPDEFRKRLYEIGQSPSTPVPAPQPAAVEEVEEKAAVREYYAQKRLHESLEEWKWKRLNRLKNIIVLAAFLTMGLFVWSNREAVNLRGQKDQDEQELLSPFLETAIPTLSVLESVEWNESPDSLPFYTKLESPESILEKTSPKPLNPPPRSPASPANEIRPASL